MGVRKFSEMMREIKNVLVRIKINAAPHYACAMPHRAVLFSCHRVAAGMSEIEG